MAVGSAPKEGGRRRLWCSGVSPATRGVILESGGKRMRSPLWWISSKSYSNDDVLVRMETGRHSGRQAPSATQASTHAVAAQKAQRRARCG